jgi:drug/metabolite transporter (DMT)-like permease
MFFEAMGISMSTNIITGVILSLAPVSAVICETLILKERSTWLQKIFLGIGIVGVVYIAVMTNTAGSEDSKNSWWGILFLLLAVVSGSLFVTFSRKSSKHFNAMEVTYISAMLGAVAFNAVNVVRHLINGSILHYFDPFFNPENLLGFLVLGVVSTIIATGMNNFALGHMQISTMSAFSGLSTLVTIAVGVIFNHEPLYYFHWIGLVLIVTRMVGVSVIAIQKDRKAREAEAAESADGSEVSNGEEVHVD